MLWLIHIKNIQHPTGTVCKLLMLIADYIQLDFNSETTLLKSKKLKKCKINVTRKRFRA